MSSSISPCVCCFCSLYKQGLFLYNAKNRANIHLSPEVDNNKQVFLCFKVRAGRSNGILVRLIINYSLCTHPPTSSNEYICETQSTRVCAVCTCDELMYFQWFRMTENPSISTRLVACDMQPCDFFNTHEEENLHTRASFTPRVD